MKLALKSTAPVGSRVFSEGEVQHRSEQQMLTEWWLYSMCIEAEDEMETLEAKIAKIKSGSAAPKSGGRSPAPHLRDERHLPLYLGPDQSGSLGSGCAPSWSSCNS